MKIVRLSSIALSLTALAAVAPPAVLAADQPNLIQDAAKQRAAEAEVSAVQQELRPLLNHGEVFGDDAKRTEAAPKVIPLLKRLVAVFDQSQQHVLRTTHSVEYKFQPLGMLAYFGDKKIAAQLKDGLQSKDPEVQVEAAAATAMSDWWMASHDASAQKKVLDTLRPVAIEHANDDQLAIALMMMANLGSSSPDMHDAAMKIIANDLRGVMAQRFGESIKSEMQLKQLEGKPLVVAARSLDGSNFTTANWKGKVILVDFWATWCGPCRAELPRVKKAYADYHAKGLEVLGVSCDRSEEALHKFLSDNPDMPWPQLFDPATAGWHPLATGYGIRGIPTMFLIDKAGVLRSVTARQNFEEMIPKMLEEK